LICGLFVYYQFMLTRSLPFHIWPESHP